VGAVIIYACTHIHTQIESLSKALNFSQDENFRLKAQIARVSKAGV